MPLISSSRSVRCLFWVNALSASLGLCAPGAAFSANASRSSAGTPIFSSSSSMSRATSASVAASIRSDMAAFLAFVARAKAARRSSPSFSPESSTTNPRQSGPGSSPPHSSALPPIARDVSS